MSSSLPERQAARTAFLLAAYELADGNRRRTLSGTELSDRLGLLEDETRNLVDWCADQGYVEGRTFGNTFNLSASGVAAAEDLLSRGHSVPLSVLILSVEEQRAVEAFLSYYRNAVQEGVPFADPNDRLDAEAQVRTVEEQLRAPKPRRRVIRAALRELYGLLHGAGGNAVFELLKRLLENLG